MKSYRDFAQVYDALMHTDIHYERLADMIENIFDEYHVNADLVCDLACGTGNVTLPMARRGYDMLGVDISEEMLSVARDKAYEAGQDILFLRQSITSLDLYGTVDAFLCMIDGFNYVLSPRSLLQSLQRINQCFLNPGGIVVFDVSTHRKLSKTIGSNTFVHSDRDIFYTWQNRYIASKQLCDMYLNFFVRSGGIYRRFEERHLQRAYTKAELSAILTQAGFSDMKTYSAASFDKREAEGERIVFAAKKQQ